MAISFSNPKKSGKVLVCNKNYVVASIQTEQNAFQLVARAGFKSDLFQTMDDAKNYAIEVFNQEEAEK